ncbi:hypothetical protein Tco_0613972 [Tanacetum coccineum]
MVKRDVEIETVDECVDEIDKLAELMVRMQQSKRSGCVHASNEHQLHVRHVFQESMNLINICSVQVFEPVLTAVTNLLHSSKSGLRKLCSLKTAPRHLVKVHIIE